MSTTAGKGSHPFSRIRTVFRPVGCVASGTSTSPATSSAPHAIAPRRWRRMVFSAKSKSHSKRDRKSNPSKPPTTSGSPAAERSVTTASSGPSVSDPTLTASMVIFCRTVSPMEPRPRIAAPSRHSSPIISRSFGDTNAAVAPESMRKSTRPPFAPTSRVMRTYPARGFPGMPTIWRSGTRTASSRFASHASASARARSSFSKNRAAPEAPPHRARNCLICFARRDMARSNRASRSRARSSEAGARSSSSGEDPRRRTRERRAKDRGRLGRSEGPRPAREERRTERGRRGGRALGGIGRARRLASASSARGVRVGARRSATRVAIARVPSGAAECARAARPPPRTSSEL